MRTPQVYPFVIEERQHMEGHRYRCDTSGWVRAMAWSQMIINVLLALLSGNELHNILSTGHTAMEPILRDFYYIQPFDENLSSGSSRGIAVLLCMMAYFIFGALMGGILLIGVNEKNLKCLNAWTIFTCVKVIVELIIVTEDPNDAQTVLQIVALAVFYGCCISVIRSFAEDVVKSRRQGMQDLKAITTAVVHTSV